MLPFVGLGDIQRVYSTAARHLIIPAMETTTNDFDSAVAHYQAGRMDAAASICVAVLIRQPKHIGALRMHGLIALRSGHAGSAIESLTKAAREAGDDAQVLTELGFAYLKLDRLEEAADTFGRVVAIAPDVADGHNYLGTTYRRMKRFDEAVAAYRRAIELRPEFAEALLNLGVALQSQKRLEEALRFYKRALALLPSSARFIALNLSSMGKGMLWLDPENLQRHLESLVDDE